METAKALESYAKKKPLTANFAQKDTDFAQMFRLSDKLIKLK